MSGGAHSNTFPHTLEVSSLSALASVHVAELDWGARAWVEALQESYYLTDDASLIPNSTTIIAPVPQAIVGKPSARWLAESVVPGAGITTVENNQIPVLPNENILNFGNRFALANNPGNASTDVALRTGLPYVNQTDWYIDPVAGDDTAAGTIAAPLKTLTEWASRMGHTTIQVAMTVHVLSDLNPGDVPMGPINVGNGGVLTITAPVTIVQSSTFAAVTPAAPATNTPWSATAAAVNWAAVIAAGQRIKMTAGASLGAVAWPMLDHGGGSADFSWPMTADPTLGPFGQTQETLTTDTFNVEELVKLGAFALRVHVESGLSSFNIVDCDLGGGGFSCTNGLSQSSTYGCQLQGGTSEIGANYVNSGSTVGIVHANAASVDMFGGLVMGNVVVQAGSFAAFDFDFAIQGGNLQCFNGGEFIIGRVQIWNWVDGADGAGGLEVWQFATVEIVDFIAGSKRLWGSSALPGTNGIHIENMGVVEYDADTTGLTIVGVSGAAAAVVIGPANTALDYGGLPFLSGSSSLARRQAAPQPNATNVLADSTNLAVPVNANGEFAFSIEATLLADGGGAVGFEVTLPGGGAGTFTWSYISTAPKSGIGTIGVRVDQTVGAAGEQVGLNIKGSFLNGATDGTLHFQFASVGAGTTTLQTDSNITSVRSDQDAVFSGMILL